MHLPTNNTLIMFIKVTSYVIQYIFCSERNVKEFFKTLKELSKERNELIKVIQAREKEYKKLSEVLR